jgi:nucleoside-diphosphate-sugar epimerase
MQFGDEGIAGLHSPDLQIIRDDICNTIAVSSAIKGADCVILLSAIVGRRFEDIKWSSPRNINLLASSVVLDAALEHGAHRFIFASSDVAYGGQTGVMYETSLPRPVSLYARLKLRLEERILNHKHRDFHPTVLRIATCHGFAPRMRFDLVANQLILDAVCKKELYIDSGEQCRSLVSVDDAARSFLFCLRAHENLVSGEIFNVGAQEQTLQVNQLANLVKSLVPDAVISVREAEPDLVDYHLSCSKIRQVLNFVAERSLVDSITEVRDRLVNGYFDDPYSLRYHNF